MKDISELKKYDLLMVAEKNGDYNVISVEDFLESDIYLNKENREVFIANERLAKFVLYDALEYLEGDMYEDWLDTIMNDIPEEVKKHIEDHVNYYTKKNPSYECGEEVLWMS